MLDGDSTRSVQNGSRPASSSLKEALRNPMSTRSCLSLSSLLDSTTRTFSGVGRTLLVSAGGAQA